jgi:3-deoxy-D-manno-octulosonic-acid transferase
MFLLYKGLSFFFNFFAHTFLKIRIFKNKEDPQRYKEKLGIYKIQNFYPVIWFHAASLGEIKSIASLIFNYSKNNKILITTSTLSSSTYCKDTFKNYSNIIHQFAPLDTPQIVKKFLEHWKPRLSIFVESELWPNLIFQSKKTSKLILLNARLSDRSFKRWKLIKNFAKKILEEFDSIVVQSKKTKAFLEFFNVHNIKFFGNLKFVHSNEEINNNNFTFIKKVNFTWVAMSTHDGEEKFIIETIKNIKKTNNQSQCVLIPRHVSRTQDIINLLKENNLTWQLRTNQTNSQDNADIFILDTYGEAKEIFKKNNLVFLGGSIIAHGGQNPLEPAREGCILFHGPHIYNFEEIYEFLQKNNIAHLTSTPEILASQLLKNHSNPPDNKKFVEIINQHGQKILIDHINYLNSFI